MTRFFTSPMAIFLIVMMGKLVYVRSAILDSPWWETAYVELPVFILLYIIIETIGGSFPRIRVALHIISSLVITFILFAMIVYYQYFGTIVTYTSLFELNQTGEVGDSIRSLIKPQYYGLLADLPFLALGLIVPSLRKRWINERIPIKWMYGWGVAALCIVIGLFNVLQSIGGGKLNELRKAQGMGLLTYEAYVVYVNAKRDYMPVHAIDPRAVRHAKGLNDTKNKEAFGIAAGKDVYVIQLESVQAFTIGLNINGQEVTPNLNRLMEQSYYFDRFFQQIGKGNTSDAEFITNTSLYPTGIMPMSKQTAGHVVPSLPRLLAPHHYESVTLHTNDASFWSRDSMYPALGFDRYYDKAYFGEEDVIAFGASDEVLYRKSLDVFKEIKARGKRIYANLIAMSSHNPFQLPEGKATLSLPPDLQGTFLGDYVQSVNYADRAFGVFVDELKANGLWDDAVIVVYGDHFGVPDNRSKEDNELAAKWIGVPQYTKVQMFNVPLIIRVPGHDEGSVHHNLGGQIDILPTLANLLGIDIQDGVYFGQDLLNDRNNLIGQRTYLPSGSFLNEEIMFIPGKSFDDGKLLPLSPDVKPKSLNQYRADYHKALQLLEMSDSYVHNL